MYKHLSFAIYCIFLALIALSSTMLQSDLGIDVDDHLPQNKNSSRFEYATINAYDNTAGLLYRLISPVVYYRQDSGFEFEKPEFVYQNSVAMPLSIISDKGYMENNSTFIELLGNVSLARFNAADNINEYLYTSNATIDLDSKKAYTNDKATFEQYKKTTEGIGMVADLEAQTVKLQSNIKVLSVP